MARCARRKSCCDMYHVIARGTSKQLIFEDDVDRSRFLELMRTSFHELDVSVLAYVLMDNHIHILAQSSLENLSKGLRRLLGTYALRFNKRHNRCGHLFGERFQSEPVEDDDNLLTVVRYIHNNPVAASLSSTASWKWSSYQEYLGKPGFTKTDLVLDMLGGVEAFEEFHELEHVGKLPMEASQASSQQKRLSDRQAGVLAASLIGKEALGALKQAPKKERDAAIRLLKGNGISARQIQRLTGLSLGSISKA